MFSSGRCVLGLSVQPQSITVVEVEAQRRRKGSPRVRRAAEFAFPDGASLEAPGELGDALARFLKDCGFTARRAVIGVPASWLVVKPKMLPPADADDVLAMVRLTAERAFSTDAHELCVDYTLDRSDNGSRRVLLVAALRRKIDLLAAIAARANLRVAAITCSLMQLAAATAKQKGDDQLLLCITPESIELAGHVDGRLSMVKHLATQVPHDRAADATWARSLANELGRATTAMTASANGRPRRLVMWDGAQIGSRAIEVLADGLAIHPQVQDNLASLGIDQHPWRDSGEVARHAASAALALSGTPGTPGARPGSATPIIDFLRARLDEKQTSMSPRRRWLISAAVGLTIAAAALGFDLARSQAVLGELKRAEARLAPGAEQVRALREKVRFARSWYQKRPRPMDCLSALTRAFPEEGAVWALNVAMAQDLTGSVVAKSVDESSALAVLDAMRSSPHFSDAKLAYLRHDDRRSGEVSFSIDFVFAQE